MNDVIEYKSIGTPEMMLKDIDESEGRVLGYFAKFGNVDSDNDMIMPGAFTRTLKNNGARIKHLYQHNPSQPLSGVKNSKLIITEDKDGLSFDSTITKTSYGKDVILLYADGVIDEHSIGFNTVNKKDKTDYRELTELKLWEGSTVTWGANETAGTSGVKSLTKEQAISKMDIVLKAFRNGKYENDEIFDLLEIYFKQLQQIILDISIPATDPPKNTLPADIKEAFTTFRQSLIIQ